MTGLVPRLPRLAWLVFGGDALSAVGSGLTLPFLLVYLHQIKGTSYGLAGLVPLENRIRAVDLGFVTASGGSDVLVDEAAQDRFSSDSLRIEVGHGDAGLVV